MIKDFLALQKSFSARIIFLLIVTMVVMAVLFDLVLISMLNKAYRSTHDDHGASLIRLLAHSVRLPVYTENEEELSGPVNGLLLQEDVVEVVVCNKEGRVLLQKTKSSIEKPFIDVETEKIKAVLDQLAKSGNLSMETSEGFIYLGQVFFIGDGAAEENWYFEETASTSSEKEIVGYVAVTLSKEMFSQGIRHILIQTGISVLIFLVIGVFMTVFIIRKVTQPLRELVLNVRKGKEDIYDPGDLSVLSKTYANLVEDLESSFQTIHELNEKLEEKVEDRTLQLTNANEELFKRQRKLESSNARLVTALRGLKETQEQLVQKEKLAAMGQLVAGVAHEINNTVNFISGALPSLNRSLEEIKEVLAEYDELEQAQESGKLDDKFIKVRELKEELSYEELFGTIDQLMANIDEGTRRTTRIIRDLKTFPREDTGDFISADLHAVIDSTIHYLDTNLLSRVTLKQVYGELPSVSCLPGNLSQVFLNIMHNGLQAMEGEGVLTIRTERRNDCVHLFFTDTGCGISKEDLPKIFEPFFTNKEVGEGSGLGLGISYTIIKQHGGEIGVQSERGRGTTFEIILPIAPEGIDRKQDEFEAL